MDPESLFFIFYYYKVLLLLLLLVLDGFKFQIALSAETRVVNGKLNYWEIAELLSMSERNSW